jgi:acyl-CoA synthetase (AMP-forming)/AMP-acid ligase II
MPESLLDAMDAGLTHAFLTPAAIGRLDAADLLERFDRLALVAYGAAPMTVPRLRRAMEAWPRTRFVQVYGVTECVAVLTVLGDADHRDEAHPERLRSCGRPTPGVEVRLVDGELWFRTEQIMAGYLGSPAATADVVVDGWMRTGDLGRVDDDGYVYVEDRLKDLVLVNGWSVFPAEVERVLSDHPAVLECAVIGVPDEATGESVLALVRVRDGQAADAEDVVDHCRQHLAEHKVPSSVQLVDDFPRNTLGKIVKRELRAPYWASTGRRI